MTGNMEHRAASLPTPYRVDIPGFDVICIRPLVLDQDIADLHDWFNRDYARFWGLQGKSREQVHEIYRALVDRPGSLVLIGSLMSTEEKIFLLETYQPDADGLGQHYRAEPSDRGFHFFLAPARVLIPALTYHAFTAMLDYLFQDPSVQRIVAEPDIRNHKALARLVQRGFQPAKVVQLHNKTAQLVVLNRTRFSASKTLAPPKIRLPPQMARANFHVFIGRVIRKLRTLRRAPGQRRQHKPR